MCLAAEDVRVDLKKVKARKDAIVLNFRSKNEAAVREYEGLHTVPWHRAL